MDEIQRILTDCEELVNQELELEIKLNNKTSLIERQKQVLQITSSSEEGRITELEDQLLEEKEKVKENAETNQKQEAQFEEEKEQSLQLQIGQLQRELTYHQSWKQKHLNDIKEKNTRVIELEERLVIQQQAFHQKEKNDSFAGQFSSSLQEENTEVSESNRNSELTENTWQNQKN